jgi:hypothetical protein
MGHLGAAYNVGPAYIVVDFTDLCFSELYVSIVIFTAVSISNK